MKRRDSIHVQARELYGNVHMDGKDGSRTKSDEVQNPAKYDVEKCQQPEVRDIKHLLTCVGGGGAISSPRELK